MDKLEWLAHNNRLVGHIRSQIVITLGLKDLEDDMEVELDQLAEDLALDLVYSKDDVNIMTLESVGNIHG